MGRAVQPRIFRIVDVRIERAAHIIPPRMFGAVRRQAEMHALGTRRLGDLDDHVALRPHVGGVRSEENTSELQSLMRISYDVFCLKQKTQKKSSKSHKQTIYSEKE